MIVRPVTLCRVCFKERYYFNDGTRRCTECPRAVDSNVVRIIVPLVCLVLLVTAAVVTLVAMGTAMMLPPRISENYDRATAHTRRLHALAREVPALFHGDAM